MSKREIRFQATILEIENRVSKRRIKYLRCKLSTGSYVALSSNSIADHLVESYFTKLGAPKSPSFDDQVMSLKNWHIPLTWAMRVETEDGVKFYSTVRLEGCECCEKEPAR